MGRAKCVPPGEGRRGYVKTPGFVSSCTVTHGNGLALRRLQGRVCFTSVFTSPPKVVYVCLFVPTLRFRRPFTLPSCRIRAAVVARPSCPRHAPCRVLDVEANCAGSAETSSRRTKRPRWLLFKRCHRPAAPESLPAGCVKRDVYARTLRPTLRARMPELQTMREACCASMGAVSIAVTTRLPCFSFLFGIPR